MSNLPSRLALIVLSGGLILAGCSDKTTRPSTTTTTTSASTSTGASTSSAAAPQGSGTRTGTTTSKPRAAKKAPAEALPDNTGVPSCDNYLATYIACHQAAAIYAPDQIEGRYEEMRNTLLRDSVDPSARPQLDRRCTSLASQLHQALHGKSCATAPASASTSANP